MDRDRSERAPRILGLTGPIGCGKTTAGDILLDLGAIERIDADQSVHGLMTPGTETTERISETFGPDILSPDGGVNRSRLAEIVFSDPSRLQQLENIVHPAVRTSIRARLDCLRGTLGVVVVDAVKLLQSDLLPLCDAVWVVTCSAETQRRRLMGIRKMSQAAVAGRLQAQPSFDHPCVSTVIQNSGSLEDLRSQIAAAWTVQMEVWRGSAGSTSLPAV